MDEPEVESKVAQDAISTRPMPGVFAAAKYVVYIEWEFSRKVAPRELCGLTPECKGESNVLPGDGTGFLKPCHSEAGTPEESFFGKVAPASRRLFGVTTDAGRMPALRAACAV
jgi:hypothetical protein